MNTPFQGDCGGPVNLVLRHLLLKIGTSGFSTPIFQRRLRRTIILREYLLSSPRLSRLMKPYAYL